MNGRRARGTAMLASPLPAPLSRSTLQPFGGRERSPARRPVHPHFTDREPRDSEKSQGRARSHSGSATDGSRAGWAQGPRVPALPSAGAPAARGRCPGTMPGDDARARARARSEPLSRHPGSHPPARRTAQGGGPQRAPPPPCWSPELASGRAAFSTACRDCNSRTAGRSLWLNSRRVAPLRRLRGGESLYRQRDRTSPAQRRTAALGSLRQDPGAGLAVRVLGREAETGSKRRRTRACGRVPGTRGSRGRGPCAASARYRPAREGSAGTYKG